MGGYKSFNDIKAWQLGREFRKRIYSIANKFPTEEKFILTSQIKRSAISITANIAEGYGRYIYQENINFCRISRGSLNETIDHICAAYDENYINKDEFESPYREGRAVERAINGYIGYLKNQQANNIDWFLFLFFYFFKFLYL